MKCNPRKSCLRFNSQFDVNWRNNLKQNEWKHHNKHITMSCLANQPSLSWKTEIIAVECFPWIGPHKQRSRLSIFHTNCTGAPIQPCSPLSTICSARKAFVLSRSQSDCREISFSQVVSLEWSELWSSFTMQKSELKLDRSNGVSIIRRFLHAGPLLTICEYCKQKHWIIQTHFRPIMSRDTCRVTCLLDFYSNMGNALLRFNYWNEKICQIIFLSRKEEKSFELS